MTTGRISNVGKVIDKSPWWAPWLVVLVLVIGFVFSSIQTNIIAAEAEAGRVLIRDAAVESCERVNVLRNEVNKQGAILSEFLAAAAEARQRTADTAEPGSDQQAISQGAALRYLELSKQMSVVDIPNCEEEFPQSVEFDLEANQ